MEWIMVLQFKETNSSSLIQYQQKVIGEAWLKIKNSSTWKKIICCCVKISWERVNPSVNLYFGLPVFLRKFWLGFRWCQEQAGVVVGNGREAYSQFVISLPVSHNFFSVLTKQIGNGRQIWRQACLNMTFRKMYLDTTRMNPNWLLSLFISFEKESKWETYLADYIFNIFLKNDLSQLCPPFTNLF